MLRKIAVVLMEDVAVFEFGVLSEVFGIDRTDDGRIVFPFDSVHVDFVLKAA